MASRRYANESDEPAALLRDLCIEIINEVGTGDLREIYKLATTIMHGNSSKSPRGFIDHILLEESLEKFVYSTYHDKKILRRMNEAIHRLRNTKSGDFSKQTTDCLQLMFKLIKLKCGDSSDDSSLSIGNNLSISRSSKEEKLDESPLANNLSQTFPINQYHILPTESSAITFHRGSGDIPREKMNKTPCNGVKEVHIGSGDSSSNIHNHTGSGVSLSKIYSHTGSGDSLSKIYGHSGSGDSLSKIHITQKKLLHKSQRSESNTSRRPDTLNISLMKSTRHNDVTQNVTDLLIELTFCFVGIPGKIIENDGGDEFRLNPRFELKDPQVILHLTKIGTVYKKVTRYSENIKKRGAVGQAVWDAVLVILQKFLSKVADLRGRIEIAADIVEDTPLSEQLAFKFPTFKQIIVVFKNDLSLLQYLSDVLSCLQNKHGGQIISCLAFYVSNVPLQKTDYVHSITILFSYASRPYYMMIADWITKGTLNDKHNEVFIESLTDVCGKNTWEKEYKIRKEMLPDFITVKDAELIIEVGRWTNFLHFCKELPQLTKGQLSLQKYVLRSDDGNHFYVNDMIEVLRHVTNVDVQSLTHTTPFRSVPLKFRSMLEPCEYYPLIPSPRMVKFA